MEWGIAISIMGVILTQYFRYENYKENQKENKRP
jgi:hypothetical protein